MERIAVFCGSREGKDPIYMQSAKAFGNLLAEKEIGLVYGGAVVGIMGAVAEGVLDKDGHAIGVIPKKLLNIEIAHDRLNELHVVDTMHERKAMMADLSDAFVALPGGAGTLEEWFEVFTWAQIGYHNKPCAFLNTNGYYTPLLELFDHMVEQGFASPDSKDLIIIEDDPKKLLEQIKVRLSS